MSGITTPRERFDPIFRQRFPVWYPENAEYPGGAHGDKPRRPLARAKLVGIRKRVFQHFHHRDHAGRLILNAFDRRARLAQIGE